jgi:hypothetical protein
MKLVSQIRYPAGYPVHTSWIYTVIRTHLIAKSGNLVTFYITTKIFYTVHRIHAKQKLAVLEDSSTYTNFTFSNSLSLS